MKVLLVCEFGTLNGGENSLLAVLPHLIERGISFSAAVPNHSDLAGQLQAMQIECHDYSVSIATARVSREDKLRRLKSIVEVESFDLVHANSLSMSRLLGCLAPSLTAPTIGHMRDMINLSRTAIRDLSANSKLIAVSDATKRWYQERGVDSSKIQVIRNGVSVRQFFPRERNYFLHDELGIDHASPLFVSIGQLGMRKGVDVTLEAFRDVLRSISSSNEPETGALSHPHLVLAGERHSQKDEAIEYEQRLFEMSSELKGHVHFLGRRNDTSAILNEASLFIHSARQEPLGRVLLEAAASGCCILATDVGGTREIFPEDSEAAILIPADDPRELTRQILRTLRNEPLRTYLGQAACSRAASFSLADCAAKLQRTYEQLDSL